MLAPDLEKTKAALTKTFTAAEVITIYSGAMRYIVGPLMAAEDFPGWFDPVKASVSTAVRNGSDWMDDLCIDLTTAVPQTIVSFNTRFQDISDDLINLQTEISMGGGGTTPEQQKLQQQKAIDLFRTLKAELTAIEPDMKADHKRITALLGGVQADHEALSKMDSLVSNNIPDGGTISKQITADLGDDFMDITPNGPCMVSLALKTSVDATIKRTAGAHAELLPYLIALAVLKKALSDNEKATLAFSQVLNVWSFMEGLVDSAIEDLAKGAAKDVIDVLREAMLDAAQQVWEQLSETAQSLSSSTKT